MDVIDFLVTAAFGAVFREIIQFGVESVKAFKAAWNEENKNADKQ